MKAQKGGFRMEIQFYQNLSPKNVLEKSIITYGDLMTGQFVDGSSIDEPHLILTDAAHDFQNGRVNYAFIAAFRRYYYLQEVMRLNATQTKIVLHCDVLMTIKANILKGRGYVSKCENFHGDIAIPGASPVFANDGQNPDLYERLFSPTGTTAFKQLGGNYKTGAGSYILITAG